MALPVYLSARHQSVFAALPTMRRRWRQMASLRIRLGRCSSHLNMTQAWELNLPNLEDAAIQHLASGSKLSKKRDYMMMHLSKVVKDTNCSIPKSMSMLF